MSGVCYELPAEGLEQTLRELDVRERHGYTRALGTVRDMDGVMHECFVYYNDEADREACMWNEEVVARTLSVKSIKRYNCSRQVSETAEVIARAVGPSGTNIEYLRELVMATRQLGLDRDVYLEDLLVATESLPSGSTELD